MTQNPGQWGPQGGYPPQGQGSYPPQQPSPGYPPQQPGPGYPPQGGYAPQPGYNPQGTYAPQGGYPPQGPQPPQGGGYIPPPAEPTKKSPAMIIGIVVAAVVLLAAVGGIIMVLTRDGEQPPPVTITPSQPVPPTEQPTEQPTAQPSTDQPQPTPSESSAPPSGEAVDLGKGISLAPAPGWEVEKTGQGVAQLSDDKSVFLGQAIQVEPSTNAGQLCDAWHRKVAEGSSNGKFAEPQTGRPRHHQAEGGGLQRAGHRQQRPGFDDDPDVLPRLGAAERRSDRDRHDLLHAQRRYPAAGQGLQPHDQLHAAGSSEGLGPNAAHLDDTGRTRPVSLSVRPT